MARPKKSVQTQELRLALSPAIRGALEDIAKTGLRGASPNEVAIRLIEGGLNDLVSEIKELQENVQRLAQD